MDGKIIGFVPARGGSKSILQKNLQVVGGKPLVVRAIETLRAVEEVEQVYLSTDSPCIAEVGEKAGAIVPFLRPKELASDESPVLEALHYTLVLLEKNGGPVDWIVMVQPTSPFVKPQTVSSVLKHAIRLSLIHI